MTKKRKKMIAKKNISSIAIYLSLGLYKGCPSYRRSLQSSKENISTAIQNMKFLHLLFTFFVGNFCPPVSGSAFLMLIRIRIQHSN
jgi:hypothetical protein